jgi:two-component system, OmpR family, sensor histidine kinase KdpD
MSFHLFDTERRPIHGAPLHLHPGASALRFIACAVVIGIETYASTRWIAVNPTTVGFLYLVSILLIATSWGLAEALAASILATLCFNFFFFPPIGAFRIDDPLNWVALIAFLITSISASQLSQRARHRTREALNRQLEMERLYAVGRAILLADPQRPLGEQIVREIARIYDLEFVGLYDRASDAIHQGGPEDVPDVTTRLRDAAMSGTLFRDEDARMVVTPVSFGAQPVGSLALKGLLLSDAALQALSNLVALGLEKTRAQEAAIRVNAARQSEEFKATLMDAVAHEFKTPLTSLRAAISAILSSSVSEPQQQQEMLQIINEATERLSALVSETIRLARVEADGLRLKKQPFPIGAAIHAVLRQMEPDLEGRDVALDVAENLPSVLADEELIQLVLRHLIDNAAKYSPSKSPLSISARVEGDCVVVGVRNQGEGISEWEKSRIFEKFYRGAGARERVPGTGMGLAITRDIVLAHGGRIRVESARGEGAEFFFSLPLAVVGNRA